MQWASRNPAAAAEVTPGSPAARPQPAPGLGSLDPDPVGGLVLGTKDLHVLGFGDLHFSWQEDGWRSPAATSPIEAAWWGSGAWTCMFKHSSTAPCSCPAVNTSPVTRQHLSLPVPQRCWQLLTKCLDAGQTAPRAKSPAVASDPNQTVGKRWAAVGIGAKPPAFVA